MVLIYKATILRAPMVKTLSYLSSKDHCFVLMDALLSEVAQSGDATHLQQLLRENPLILDSFVLLSTENPLNIATVLGKIDFVKEIIQLKPNLAKETNRDGFSPMHIAAANGHVEIVKELMQVDPNLCQLEGREKRTPLYHTTIKGRLEVISVDTQFRDDLIWMRQKTQ